jgi:hypothetical protein
MEWVALWFGLAVIVGVAASVRRGRNGFGWFLLSLVISPLLTGLLVLALPDLRVRAREDYDRESGRRCPFCAELIKKEAIVCKHCGRDLPALTPPPPPKRWAHVDPGQTETVSEGERRKASLIFVAALFGIVGAVGLAMYVFSPPDSRTDTASKPVATPMATPTSAVPAATAVQEPPPPRLEAAPAAHTFVPLPRPAPKERGQAIVRQQ